VGQAGLEYLVDVGSRLTTYTIMFLLYVAYFMLRSAMDDPARRARFAAVYGIFAFLSVRSRSCRSAGGAPSTRC